MRSSIGTGGACITFLNDGIRDDPRADGRVEHVLLGGVARLRVGDRAQRRIDTFRGKRQVPRRRLPLKHHTSHLVPGRLVVVRHFRA